MAVGDDTRYSSISFVFPISGGFVGLSIYARRILGHTVKLGNRHLCLCFLGLSIWAISQMLVFIVLVGLLVLPVIVLAVILVLRQRRQPTEAPEFTKEEAKPPHKELDKEASELSKSAKSETPIPDCVLVPAPLVNNSPSFPYRHSLDAC